MRCRAENCERNSETGLGYCVMHYKRWMRNGTTERVLAQYSAAACCSYCGRGGRLRKGLCKPCSLRMQRKGYVERDIAPQGSGTINKDGYRVVTIDGKREYEHRIIAGARPGQVVHHDNEIKSDNDEGNLLIFENQSAHAKHHASKR